MTGVQTCALPISYKAEYAEQAYKLCLLGLSDEELAQYFKVSDRTLAAWKDAHPEFLRATVDGKVPADANVAKVIDNAAKNVAAHDASAQKNSYLIVCVIFILGHPIAQLILRG